MSHDMGFVGMFLTGMAGMAPGIDGELVVLQTPESFLADPASWLRLCSSHRATITSAPNFAFELACRAAPFLTQIDLSSLRVCITGAERVSAPTLERFTSTFAPRGLRPEVICPAYGMAEAALAVTLVRPGETWRSLRVDRSALARGEVLAAVSEQDAVEYVSNGTILPGLEVRIMPSDAAGAGGGAQSLRVGEVQIRGESLFSGYIGADAVLTSDGWFPTRDAGFIQDGELFLAGRNDETIIVGGQNHYAADIEQALSHDLVRPGTLAAVPLVSGFALLAEPVGDPEVTALDHACRELAVRSARQAGLRPAVVGFVARGRLPKTPSGKPQRLRMAAALAQDRLPMLASVRFDPSYRQG
jgi:fatty-acyl-CoA synthase